MQVGVQIERRAETLNQGDGARLCTRGHGEPGPSDQKRCNAALYHGQHLGQGIWLCGQQKAQRKRKRRPADFSRHGFPLGDLELLESYIHQATGQVNFHFDKMLRNSGFAHRHSNAPEFCHIIKLGLFLRDIRCLQSALAAASHIQHSITCHTQQPV